MTADPALPAPPAPTFREALRFWLQLGLISFGGPAGQIAIMHQELVERRRWISERRFLHALNYCMVLPGPEAQQLAIYIGWLLHRQRGGIVAGSLFVLPSLLILIALSYIYLRFGDLPPVRGVFDGIKPAVVAIVGFAAWRIGSRVLKSASLWALAVSSLLAVLVLDLAFPYVVLGAAAIGLLGGRWAPQQFQIASTHAGGHTHYGAAVIDDNTPAPAHARFSWLHLLTVVATGLLLWGVAIAAISEPTLRTMGEFFSQAALLTFGGAYAVLPYVYQGGVETYGWLSAAQMIDGLGLGETTPGPLIMVVAFVGFVGAWSHQVFGADSLLLAGCAGAAVATYFTFLPSFVFILAGAPLVEASRDEIRLTAPLTAITAAVVGVIVHLGLFFAWHVVWPDGSPATPFSGRFQAWELVVAIAAFIALWRYRQDVLKVILLCAALGLIRVAIPWP